MSPTDPLLDPRFAPPDGRPRFELIDEPALVGARWWQEQLGGFLSLPEPERISRRAAIQQLALAAGITLGGGLLLGAAGCEDEEEERIQESDALATQKQYGWSFGSEDEKLPFGAEAGAPLEAARLWRLNADLTPVQARHRPLQVNTLFESPAAQPSSPPTTTVVPLATALRTYQTPAMQLARHRGKALASLLDGAPAGRAVIIDLPGPEAVAFAAGMAGKLEPVFLFDNWPHPRGVVPSHLTLAAAATLAPWFTAAVGARPANAPPAFVLDRNRLAPYSDAASRFDNRYLARMPPLAFYRSQGITELLYVAPAADQAESDDLVEDLVQASENGVQVRMVAATDFRNDPAGAPDVFYYGGSSGTHFSFWQSYGWGTPRLPFRVAVNVSRGYAFRPVRRATLFSSVGRVGVRVRPGGFGRAFTVIGVRSGRVGGARFGRSGSFGRGGRSGGRGG